MIAIKKNKNINAVRMKTSRKVFLICNTIFIIIVSTTFLLPYLNLLAKSLNSSKDTMLGGLTFWPRVWTLANFQLIMGDDLIWNGVIVSVCRVAVGSVLGVLITFMAAYALLRKGLRGKKLIIILFTIPTFVNGGLIAEYIVFGKKMLNIYNTFWVYIFPHVFSFYNMIIMRTYLANIPESLVESARLDGAGEMTVLLRIMFPLSLPIIATIMLWLAVSHWNDWTTTLYFVENQKLFTLQYDLQLMIKETETIQKMISDALEQGRPIGDIDLNVTAESIQAAQLIFATLPILCIYPFAQKYFMNGVMIGGVKE